MCPVHACRCSMQLYVLHPQAAAGVHLQALQELEAAKAQLQSQVQTLQAQAVQVPQHPVLPSALPNTQALEQSVTQLKEEVHHFAGGWWSLAISGGQPVVLRLAPGCGGP